MRFIVILLAIVLVMIAFMGLLLGSLALCVALFGFDAGLAAWVVFMLLVIGAQYTYLIESERP